MQSKSFLDTNAERERILGNKEDCTKMIEWDLPIVGERNKETTSERI